MNGKGAKGGGGGGKIDPPEKTTLKRPRLLGLRIKEQKSDVSKN